jgi:hypothetical protein
MAALSASSAADAPIAQPAAPQINPAPTPRAAADSRFELPRRASQGNTLRLYVH